MSANAKLTYRGKFVVRALGTLFIVACVGMIICGETFLRDRLVGAWFVFYWTWCFLITLLAGILAVVDLVCVRRAAKRDRRALVEREFLGKP